MYGGICDCIKVNNDSLRWTHSVNVNVEEPAIVRLKKSMVRGVNKLEKYMIKYRLDLLYCRVVCRVYVLTS